MRFEQLEYLEAVAENGSFSAAAQKLYVTQQAVSISMKQLEEEMGRPLFVKENNKTVLTEYGEQMLAFARNTLAEKESLAERFREGMPQMRTHVRIGSTSCVANLALPSVIAGYEARKQKLFFEITSMETMLAVLEQVKSGEKDIGFISINAESFRQKFALFEEELVSEILMRDEIVAVMKKESYSGSRESLEEAVFERQWKTLFNVEPADEWCSHLMDVPFSASSNDIEFHRAMLEKMSATVVMTGLSYQHFFNTRKYIALPIENQEVTILHTAVYRRDVDAVIQEIVRKVRTELHIK